MELIGRGFSASTSTIKNRKSLAKSFVKFDLEHYVIKRYKKSDLPSVMQLWNDKARRLFGDVAIEYLISISYLTLVLKDLDGQTQACITLSNYPNVPTLHPSVWPSWLSQLYRLRELSARNTLWVHLMLFHNEISEVGKAMFEAVFQSNINVSYIAVVVPPMCLRDFRWLAHLGKKVKPAKCFNERKVQTLFVLQRNTFMKVYKLRRAVEEDNDEIVALLEAATPGFIQNYGEFYAANVIKYTSTQQMIVAAYKDVVIAVLCVTHMVNLDNLVKQYELDVFYSLHRVQPPPESQQTKQKMSLKSRIQELSSSALYAADDNLTTPLIQTSSIDMMSVDFESFSSSSAELDNSSKSSPSIGDSTLGSWASNADSDSFDLDIKAEPLSVSAILKGSDANSQDDSSYEDSDDSSDSAFESEYGPALLSASLYQLRMNGLQTEDSVEPVEPIKTGINENIGNSNCFAIEIAVADTGHELALVDLVRSCFQCYPNRHYCLMTKPTMEPHFPMMNLFFRIPPKPDQMYTEDIYMVNRGSCSGILTVRQGTFKDFFTVADMIDSISNSEDLLQQILDNLYLPCNYLYLLFCESQLVGFSMLAMDTNFDFIKAEYVIEVHVNVNMHKVSCIGSIKCMVLSPNYKRASQFFLAEIHRLSGYTLLTYYILPEDGVKFRHIAINLGDLTPVRPRHMSDFDSDSPNFNKKQENLNALYISTLQLCSLPRRDVNAKIIVIGTSTTGIAFLDTLLFNNSDEYKANFNNLFVVAPYNAMRPTKPTEISSYFSVKTSEYDYRYLHKLGFHTYVNFVKGIMTAIRRDTKEIVIDENKKLSYDYLFLFCGKQFGKPRISKPKRLGLDKFAFNRQLDMPNNVFIINTEEDCDVALRRLNQLTKYEETVKIIVYGRCHEAYCCIAGLLEMGFFPEEIEFVESPAYKRKQDFIFNHQIDNHIQEVLAKLGIAVYTHYQLLDYEFTSHRPNFIKAAIFETWAERIIIECTAMFAYSYRACSTRTFQAMDNAGLVYDGGLVINSDCTTHDKSIYAAGPVTKFAGRFHSEHLVHAYFNSEEVGETLGRQIRKKFIREYDEDSAIDALMCQMKSPISNQYFKPILKYCHLPDDTFYFYVRNPGAKTSPDFMMSDNHNGTELVTGNLKYIERQGYFKLYLNEFNNVASITCVSKEKIDYFNLSLLYGKHEQTLNNLLTRFQYCSIGNLFHYFKEPWTTALYNAQYYVLEKDIRKIMMTLKDKRGRLLSTKLLRYFQKTKFKPLTDEAYRVLVDIFEKAHYKELITKKLFDFLLTDMDLLKTYAHPGTIGDLLSSGSLEDSPLFRDQSNL